MSRGRIGVWPCCVESSNCNAYAGDTQSRIFYKKPVQVDLWKNLDCVSCLLVQSCIWCKKLADTWPKLRDVIGGLVCWLLVTCFVVCIVCHCFFIICKFLVQETCVKIWCKFLVQESWLCVTNIWLPLPLTISCSSKSRLVLPFWHWLTRVVPDEKKLQKSRKTTVWISLLLCYFAPVGLRSIVMSISVCVCLFVCASVGSLA